MNLDKQTKVSLDVCRSHGFSPFNWTTLRSTRQSSPLVSVLATKDGGRYNVRVSANMDKRTAFIVSVDKVETVIDERRSSNVATVSGCAVGRSIRTPIAFNRSN